MRKIYVFLFLILLTAIGGWEASAQDSFSEMNRKIKRLEEQLAAQQALLEELKAELKERESQNAQAAQQVAMEAVTKEMTEYKGVKGLKISGDVRLRYEGLYSDTKPDRPRYCFRARLKFDKEFKYGFAGHLHLASGSGKAYDGVELGGDPTSTNQTFTRSFEEKSFWVDRAYLEWNPGDQEYFKIGGGKFKWPVQFTWMTFDEDVNPEGFFQQLQYQTDSIRIFGNLVQYIIQENKTTSDSYMLGFQGGFDYKGRHRSAMLAFSYYDAEKYTTNWLYNPGNSVEDDILTAGDFNIIQVLGNVTFKTKYPIKLEFDMAKNLENSAPPPYADQDLAWMLGAKIGKAKNKNSWELGFNYADIEANALISAWANSDFGYTNRKGTKLSFKYQIYQNLQFAMAWYHTDKIVGSDPWDKLQLDMNFKF